MFGLHELSQFAKTLNCSLLQTTEICSQEAVAFARALRPDLGIAYGTQHLDSELFAVPRLGTIYLDSGALPSLRDGDPAGPDKLCEYQKEIILAVRRIEAKLDSGTIIPEATIPIYPHDTLRSLTLKASVVGDDLLVAAVREFASGTIQEQPAIKRSQAVKQSRVQLSAHQEKQTARRRTPHRPPRGRPLWNLLLRTLLFSPLVIVRNWSYRLRKSFPVIILFHHLITDRDHHLGMPTDMFYRHAQFLSKYYRVTSLKEAIEMLKANRVEAPTVVLTFDDGYIDNFIDIRAVVEETGVPVTFFVCTGQVSTQQPFQHDLKNREYGFLPFTWDQIRLLSQSGFEIGSHTRSHFDCGSANLEALREEIVGSKMDLQIHLGAPVSFFSFPWGLPANFSAPAVELAHATYPYIFSATGGENFPSPEGPCWFLRRSSHPPDLWELELLLQSILELERPRMPLSALYPARQRTPEYSASGGQGGGKA